MVVDTSALAAIHPGEPEAPLIESGITEHQPRLRPRLAHRPLASRLQRVEGGAPDAEKAKRFSAKAWEAGGATAWGRSVPMGARSLIDGAGCRLELAEGIRVRALAGGLAIELHPAKFARGGRTRLQTGDQHLAAARKTEVTSARRETVHPVVRRKE